MADHEIKLQWNPGISKPPGGTKIGSSSRGSKIKNENEFWLKLSGGLPFLATIFIKTSLPRGGFAHFAIVFFASMFFKTHRNCGRFADFWDASLYVFCVLSNAGVCASFSQIEMRRQGIKSWLIRGSLLGLAWHTGNCDITLRHIYELDFSSLLRLQSSSLENWEVFGEEDVCLFYQAIGSAYV